MSSTKVCGLCLTLMMLVVVGCRWEAVSKPDRQDEVKPPEEVAWVNELVRAENLILKLTPRLVQISKNVVRLEVPCDQPTADTLWKPMLAEVERFRHAKFFFVDGNFSKQDPLRFESNVGFAGVAKTKKGRWRAIRTTQHVRWHGTTSPDSGEVTWSISDWEQMEANTIERDRLMFRDVMTDSVPADEQPSLVTSIQDQFIAQSFRGEELELPYPEQQPHFSVQATMAHPSVAVVDINDDGWDDLYVMTRWQKNRLFVNQRDGTFRNEALKYGLDWGRTSCAVFADFDNDGDKDVFLGRCFVSSMLLMNEGGKFVDRTAENISQPLPGFITSASAADYDNDGLLDLYLSSYTSLGSHIGNVETAAQFMPRDHATQLINWSIQASKGDMWLERPGPPNRLLKNVGKGKFKKSTMVPEVWANTFQATWADYDQDGDVDLYLSNDFAPDYLFRNDGERGFTDVTKRAGGAAMQGYGMGVTWGDYDNDGWQDLYVSNMYSKAGKRIIAKMEASLDPRYLISANGNRLFRNQDGRKFSLVSGEGPSEIRVTKAGWSWGGQFCDFDNDGWLDLYVASGFYTAPESITCHTDL